MNLKGGDHICAMYSAPSELIDIAADFIVNGLRRGQRSWFITAGDEADAVRAGLVNRGVNVAEEIRRGALQLISGAETYVVHGAFDPEQAIRTFNEAIAKACADGFTGFRAAAEMSWAMDNADRRQQLIEYEALLRALFSTSRAIGLCLYDRNRTPLDVVNGALCTHPVTHSSTGYRQNPYYDINTTTLSSADRNAVLSRLAALDGSRPVGDA